MLFGIYLLAPAVRFSLPRVSDSMEIARNPVFLTLLAILLTLTMGLDVWDSVEEGFSLLWSLTLFVCFLALMYLFLSDSVLIYGVGHNLLGFGTHCVGAFIHVCSSQRMQVCDGPICTLKTATRICPRAQTPFHPGVASSGVAFPVLRRFKAHATHKHTEELV